MKKKTDKSRPSARAATRTAQRAGKTTRAAGKSTKSKTGDAVKRAAPKDHRGATPRKRKSAPQRPAKKAAAKAAMKKTAAKRTAARKAAAKKPERKLSAAAKKKLATQHFLELLREKQLRDAQPPPWQAIEHHDHPPRRNS